MRALTLPAVLAAVLALPAPQAAGFGNCADAAYVAQFDERLSGGIDCVEALRLPVATEAGTRHIRLVHDLSNDWAAAPGVRDEIERGMRAAAEALGRIGPFRMDDVTILLIDGLPPREEPGGPFGDTVANTWATIGDECRIGVFLLAPGARAAYAAPTIAHEIYHCVQLATLGEARMRTTNAGRGGGGDWWIEGSADWFSAFALPDMGTLPIRVAAFDTDSPTVALNDMAYGAVVFFLWLGQTAGPASILPFLHQMPTSASASAQQAAMRGALGPDAWLAFAQDYLDGRIAHPHGTALGFSPEEGTSWAWEATRTESIRLAPFVLTRGWLDYACGRWAIEGLPIDAAVSARPDPGAWSRLPAGTDTLAGEPDRFRLAAFHTAGSPSTLRIRGTLEAGCEECAGSREIDECVVGLWEMTGGGPVEWMRRNLPPEISIPDFDYQGGYTRFREDGTYFTAPLRAEITVLTEDRDGIVRGEGIGSASASGRWSAGDGRIAVCPDTQAFGGMMTMFSPRGTTARTPLAAQAPAALIQDYSCSGGSLETRLYFPDIPDPITTQYGRIDLPGLE